MPVTARTRLQRTVDHLLRVYDAKVTLQLRGDELRLIRQARAWNDTALELKLDAAVCRALHEQLEELCRDVSSKYSEPGFETLVMVSRQLLGWGSSSSPTDSVFQLAPVVGILTRSSDSEKVVALLHGTVYRAMGTTGSGRTTWRYRLAKKFDVFVRLVNSLIIKRTGT